VRRPLRTGRQALIVAALVSLVPGGCDAEGAPGDDPEAEPDAGDPRARDAAAGRVERPWWEDGQDAGHGGEGPCRMEGAPPRGPSYVDVSTCAGVEAENVIRHRSYFAIGQAWGDFDADGLPDLYVTDDGGPNTLYVNRGDGSFELAGASAEVALPERASAGAVFVDYDNDGHQDLYVLNLGPNALFHNDGGRGFTDVTARAGVGDAGRGQTASWGDYDGDGWLDLYVANWFCDCGEPFPHGNSDRLYHNEGDGTFTDVTPLLGDPITGAGFAATFLDYDDDGDLDIYLANDQGRPEPWETGETWRNVLWRNDGEGCGGWCFEDVTVEAGADLRIDAMGLAVGDYDADGDLDIYVSNSPPHMALLRNEGDGKFTEVAAAAGVTTDAGSGWGTTFLDYDLDGWLDVFLAVGPGENRMFRNLGDGTFADVSHHCGVADPADTLGVASADYDRDGRVDLVVGHRGWGYELYRNVTRAAVGAHWLALRLVGGGPVNRDAVGTRVRLRTSDGRSQMREVRCGTGLGAGDDLELHFGLGSADVEEVRIRWPDGTVETRRDLEADRHHLVRY